MKVEGPRTIETARTLKVRGAPGAGTFAPEAQDAQTPRRVAGAGPLAPVTNLIALQEVPDALSGRAKAAKRGRDMLDLLDEVRDGLLAGEVSRTTLKRLVALAAAQREAFVDPGLSSVLDEIELRARVELAKLSFEAG